MSSEYIVERRIKQQKLRRKARRGEIAIRRIYKFLRFLFILFILYSVYRVSTCHYWYLGKDIYEDKEKIEILGNEITSRNKIIAEIKKIPYENIPIYKINPAPIADQIEKLPPVKRAYVRRFWMPARLVIMVEEINPAIIIAPGETAPAVAALGFDGEFLGREYLPLKNTQNTVKILSFGTKGDDYEKWDKEKINNLYNLYKMIEVYSGEKVKYIDLRQPHDAYVQLESVKIKLGEIDPSVYERIIPLYSILSEIKQKNIKSTLKYVDLSWQKVKYLKMEN